jgi:GT2 family glycosyltransferase
MSSVMISYLHRNTVSQSFMESLMALVERDRRSANLVRYVFPVYSGPVSLPESRNVVAQVFLDESDAEWLWIVDSDMGFFPDTLHRLLESADPTERPVMAGLYLAAAHMGSDGMGGWQINAYPTVYEWRSGAEGGETFATLAEVPKNQVIQVAGAGTGCMLVHRTVLEKVRASGEQWFDRERYANGQIISEDLSFCARLRREGIPLHVDTGVRLSHHKSVWITPEGS